MIIISTVGYGYFFVNITRIKVDNFNYGYLGLFGIFILTFYSYISHFFIPHNYISNIVLISGGLISFVFLTLSGSNACSKFSIVFVTS